jgi:hypothetical protein
MLSGTEPSFAGPVRFESDKAVNTDVLFVTTYHHLPGVSDGEEIGYYVPGQEERLSHDLVQAFRHYSSLFASSCDYEDHFSCAEYGVTDDSFDEIETNVFRSVLSGAERHQPVQDLHPRDVFSGCCAVVEARLQSAETRTVLSGVGLLNDLMESGLPAEQNYGAVVPGVVQYTTDQLFRNLWPRPALAPRDQAAASGNDHLAITARVGLRKPCEGSQG